MGGPPPPGQQWGAPPPGYAPPARHGSQFALPLLNSFDWAILGTGFLMLILSFFSYYTWDRYCGYRLAAICRG